jgi:Spy/CpxP family protein refolding chaperone
MKLHTLILAAVIASVPAFGLCQQAGPRGSGAGANAGQQKPNIAKKVQEARNKVLGELGLSEQQQAQIKELDAKFAEARKALMAGAKGSGDRASVRDKVRELTLKHQADVLAVLTAEQQETFKKRMAEEIEKIRKEAGKSGR